MVDWLRVQRFFLDASLATYASSAEPETISAIPDSKVFEFSWENLHYVDMYFTRKDGKYGRSSGITLIYRDGEIIWTSNYIGWWLIHSEVLPLLKRALCAAYEAHEFYGGRGPLTFADSGSEKGLVYANHIFEGDSPFRNMPDHLKGFRDFQCEDSIFRKHEPFGTCYYKHHCHGMALVP